MSGFQKQRTRQKLRQSLELAFKYDSRVLVEQGVVAREIEVGLLGNYDVKSTLPGEVVKDVAFYDYEAKYIDNKITMAIPAEILRKLLRLCVRMPNWPSVPLVGKVSPVVISILHRGWGIYLNEAQYHAWLYPMVYVSFTLG